MLDIFEERLCMHHKIINHIISWGVGIEVKKYIKNIKILQGLIISVVFSIH